MNVIFDREYAVEVAVSKDYNPYPRPIIFSTIGYPIELCEGGAALSEINSLYSVNCITYELCTSDLDGDGQNEYIALVADKEKKFAAKCLFNSEFSVISYLTVITEESDIDECINFLNLNESGEIIDVNNDRCYGDIDYIANI